MDAAATEAPQGAILYPDSDGKPMADNTIQARWITVFHGNLAALLREQEVFVAMDLLWYAREGFPEERVAPDVMLAFGRPKGDRGSYKQWEEGDVAPQVVIEILSPGNSDEEMAKKHLFYEEHGVEDYFLYDPDSNQLQVYRRHGGVLRRENIAQHYTDPRLGICFDLSGEEMAVFYPDGRRFLTFEELEADRTEKQKLLIAAEETLRSAREKLTSTEEKLTETAEKLTSAEGELASTAEKLTSTQEELTSTATRLTSTEKELASASDKLTSTEKELASAVEKLTSREQELASTAEKLLAANKRMARLRALGRKVRRGQATPEEIDELDRLENENSSPSS